MYKMFDNMFNHFVCKDASNQMKIISCMDDYFSACMITFDRHDQFKLIVIKSKWKAIILQIFVLTLLLHVQKHDMKMHCH